jgi:hypothetical protein
MKHEQWVAIGRNFENVKKKVENILGYSPCLSDHYGRVSLRNEYININTDNNKIVEIEKRFIQLKDDIVNLFKEFNMSSSDKYYSMDLFSGEITFLDTPISVYKGIKQHEQRIKNLVIMYKRVDEIALEYGEINGSYFDILPPNPIKKSNEISFRLYTRSVNINTKKEKLEEIISKFYNLNKKINSLLKLSRYHSINQLYPFFQDGVEDDHHYYLFGQFIDEETSESEIIEIINSAQLFESKVNLILRELEIKKEYEITYKDDIFIIFEGIGMNYNLYMDYEQLKSNIEGFV